MHEIAIIVNLILERVAAVRASFSEHKQYQTCIH